MQASPLPHCPWEPRNSGQPSQEAFLHSDPPLSIKHSFCPSHRKACLAQNPDLSMYAHGKMCFRYDARDGPLFSSYYDNLTTHTHTHRFLLPDYCVFSVTTIFKITLRSFFAFSDVRVLKNVLTLFLRAKFWKVARNISLKIESSSWSQALACGVSKVFSFFLRYFFFLFLYRNLRMKSGNIPTMSCVLLMICSWVMHLIFRSGPTRCGI